MATVTGIATGTTPAMRNTITTSSNASPSNTRDVILDVFEDGARRASGFAPNPGPRSRRRQRRLKPSGLTARGKSSSSWIRAAFWESVEEIPEPHAFDANVKINGEIYPAAFEEHEHAHGAAARDNNMRAAVIHVLADAAVSVLVIVGLLLALTFGWLWMDPLAGSVGACEVIASWSYALIRDTGAILLDMIPDSHMADDVRRAIESEGDKLGDLHLWRLGPGHLGAIVCVVTRNPRGESYYREKLARFEALSHLTIEVRQAA